MHEVLVNRLGGLSLPRKSVVRLTDRPDMTLDVYRGRKTTIQQQQQQSANHCLIQSIMLILTTPLATCHVNCVQNNETDSQRYTENFTLDPDKLSVK